MNSPELKTNRLILKKPRMMDNKDFYRILSSNRDISRNIGYEPIRSIEDVKLLLKKMLKKQDNEEAMYWAIFLEKKLIGMIFFINLKIKPRTWAQKQAMLGYWIDRKYRKKGFITEAAQRVIDFAFSNLSLHKIKVGHINGNVASEKIIEKLGFKLVGIERKEFYWFDEWMEHYIYELLNEKTCK